MSTSTGVDLAEEGGPGEGRSHAVSPLDRSTRGERGTAAYALKSICERSYVLGVATDVFAVVADPTRRRILHELIISERSVGELVDLLGLSQPTVSKHLKILRDSGFVASRTAAQQRFYCLEELPFTDLEAWLVPFLQKWNRHLDRLEHYLDDDALHGSDRQSRQGRGGDRPDDGSGRDRPRKSGRRPSQQSQQSQQSGVKR